VKKWVDRVPWSVGPVLLVSLLACWAGVNYQSSALDVLREEEWRVAVYRAYHALGAVCMSVAALGGVVAAALIMGHIRAAELQAEIARLKKLYDADRLMR
jgi:hypothetical protein